MRVFFKRSGSDSENHAIRFVSEDYPIVFNNCSDDSPILLNGYQEDISASTIVGGRINNSRL
jgi:hypothetical protein